MNSGQKKNIEVLYDTKEAVSYVLEVIIAGRRKDGKHYLQLIFSSRLTVFPAKNTFLRRRLKSS